MAGDSLDLWMKAVGAVIAASAAGAGVFTYWRNALTKRAEFLMSLHKSFFVDPTYKPLKELLDCDTPAGEARLRELVHSESSDFTDFLNFFELIAYLADSGALDPADVEALLGYYLDLLIEKECVFRYIANPHNNFENLGRLLVERARQ